VNRAHAKLIERIEESGKDLLAYLSQLTDEELYRVPAPDEWSIHAVLAHLRDTEQQVFLKRTKRILGAAQPPSVENFDQVQWNRDHYSPEEPRQKIIAEFRAARRGLLRLLRKTTDKDWSRWAVHPEYGRISIEYLATHDYSHTLDHLHPLLEMRESALLKELNK
jgi:DinB superfamily